MSRVPKMQPEAIVNASLIVVKQVLERNLGRSEWLAADCQIRRLAAGSDDPAEVDCDV